LSTTASLAVVQVVPLREYVAFDPLIATRLGGQRDGDVDARARAEAEEYVNEVARRLRAHGVTATSRVMVGSPAHQIVAAASQLDADVIVMSTHGYSGAMRTLAGSTADKVVHAAGRPVLLVRRTDGQASSAADASLDCTKAADAPAMRAVTVRAGPSTAD
jgi:nucleotide-binding universal stress UspA family protein